MLAPPCIDHQHDRLAAMRSLPDLSDRLTGQWVESIVNRDLETRNVGFVWAPSHGSASRTWRPISSPSSAAACPKDWRRQYAINPVLIETFVETPKFTGATYRASGWIHVGTTQGRGRYDTKNQYALSKKHIWLCPLRRD